ncbi:MAG: hemerythrin domain-containing protein [Candidatus Woesebacteria bacterium]|nr:hemerythrin domain-containing protein [Candidatus Woesebacteria bacterium]
MKTALQILSDEHKNILEVISSLLKECDSIESGSTIDKNFFKKAIDFIRGYADKFHHAKEEDILFKEFNKLAEEGCVHCNPTQQMLLEHDLGRNFIKELEKGVEENNGEKVIKNARGYAHLLQDHIFKEDNILYPMADESLSPSVKNDILNQFKQVERELNREKDKNLLFLKELTQ